MNQILNTHINKKQKPKKQFIAIFFVSFSSIIIFITFYLSYKLKLDREEKYSTNLSQNYQIFRLYANSNLDNNFYKDSDILGNISIPKINVNYPFFYGISEDLLKIAPCRFFGEMPDENSNLCIAGHNYDDDRFFSKISSLSLGDKVFIEDNNKNGFEYYVIDMFEIFESEISSVMKHNENFPELTLLTCNNANNKRIIVKLRGSFFTIKSQ